MKYRVRGPLFVVYRPLLAIGCAWSRPSEGPASSGPVLRSITAHRPRATDPGQPATSLPLVLALAQPFENGEPCFFGVGNGDRFQFRWRIEAGDDLAYRLFAGRTLGQWGRAQGPPQSELAAADLALAVAQFVFVDGHGTRRNLPRTPGQPDSGTRRRPRFTSFPERPDPIRSAPRIQSGILCSNRSGRIAHAPIRGSAPRQAMSQVGP